METLTAQNCAQILRILDIKAISVHKNGVFSANICVIVIYEAGVSRGMN